MAKEMYLLYWILGTVVSFIITMIIGYKMGDRCTIGELIIGFLILLVAWPVILMASPFVVFHYYGWFNWLIDIWNKRIF